jgi:hypothetical protein
MLNYNLEIASGIKKSTTSCKEVSLSGGNEKLQYKEKRFQGVKALTQ